MFDFDSGSQAHAQALAMDEPFIEEIAGAGGKGPVLACLTCPSRAIGLCSDFDSDEHDRYSHASSRLSVAGDSALLLQGEPSHRVLSVVSGALMLSRLAPDGRRFVIDFVWPGDGIGMFATEYSSFSAFALGQTEVCQHSQPRFEALIKSSPRLAHRLFNREHDELSVSREHMLLLGCPSARERVARFLVHLQQRQGLRSNRLSPRVDLPMRRTDIAAYLSLTVETVSRVCQDLVRKKLIVTVPNGVRILARESLIAIGEAAPENAA